MLPWVLFRLLGDHPGQPPGMGPEVLLPGLASRRAEESPADWLLALLLEGPLEGPFRWELAVFAGDCLLSMFWRSGAVGRLHIGHV